MMGQWPWESGALGRALGRPLERWPLRVLADVSPPTCSAALTLGRILRQLGKTLLCVCVCVRVHN